MIAQDRAALAARQAQERLDLAKQQAAEVEAFEIEHADIDAVTVEGAALTEPLRRVVEFLRLLPIRSSDHLVTARGHDGQEAQLLRRDVSHIVMMALDSLKPQVIVERPLTRCLHTAHCDAGCRPY